LPKSLKQIAEQDRKLATLNEVVGADYIFGILGLKNAGKTTFIKNVLNLPNPKQETPAPYYRLTPVQTRQGLKWAVFIDGPGDHKGGAARIASEAKKLILLVDNTASADNEEFDENRGKEHLAFAKSVAEIIQELKYPVGRILVQPNKVDLWGASPAVKAKMDQLTDEVCRAFLEKQLPASISSGVPMSGENGDSAALVLSGIVENTDD